MNSKTLLCALVLMGCMSDASLVANAAQVVESQSSANDTLQVGDKAPDKYTTSATEVKDWQKRGLKAPEAGTQWVQFGGKYVLVNRGNAAIVQIQEGVN
ncbi:RcnB family protein [Pseudomonas sp. NPDC007930]|uniref:RcnB family protein n=1 Tax=Pseudomonas sp. NPDC007930 TaxID=3364417 RepID=UPI0036E6EE3E